MERVAYVDSSALVKLVVMEPETAALEADLADRPGIIASALAALECRRAIRRLPATRALTTVEDMLAAVVLIDITQGILQAAAQLGPARLRSLDAIHVATALATRDPGLDVITYDGRLAEAAVANGLRVVQPGVRT